MLAHVSVAYANPEGGSVVSGTASIASSGSTLTVTQGSNRAVIDWKSFNIGAGETTNFVQPSSSAIVLNRIGSQDPSQIFGTLTANGKIFLVNPNGFVFGKGSTINIGGILATTADIANSAFMQGRMNFSKAGKADAGIINNGTITARDAGLAGFVAPQVENNGIITARLGRVSLASGDRLTMDMYGDNLVSVAVDNQTAKHIVSNSGLIAADGGTIALTAAAGRQVANGVISNSGVIRATSVGTQNGKITLYAEGSNAVASNTAANKGKKTGQSKILNSGTIDATGENAGETGGDVTVTADSVALSSNTVISASGINGGGTVRIGGDYLGTGTTPTAATVYVASGATIYNDAVDTGNGGRTTIWSDGDTYFYGSVYGRGGWNGGNGGFVETSGHGYLDAQGYVDLTAPAGSKGLYFLDPTDITIYGNVDPAFVSTDGSINLASSLVLWLDSNDRSAITLTYSPVAATASGAAGSKTITTSASIAASLVPGARIRIGSSGTITTASMLGADTYTVASISGTTITTVESLSTSYTSAAVYRGLASSWTDKSGAGNNATATGSGMPLWVGNALNGADVLRFDGTDDMMTVADSATLDSTSGLSIFTTNTAYGLDGANPTPILSKRVSPDNNQSYSLFYYTGNQLAVDIDSTNNRFYSPAAYTNGTTNILGVVYDGTQSAGSRVKLYSGDALAATSAESSASIPNYASNLYIGAMDPTRGSYENGAFSDIMIYKSALSDTARTLLDQYQSAKWNVALSAPGTGATEVAKATSSTGYSVFTTSYLARLSQTADISLQASNNITLDLKGDTLNFTTAGRSLTLTAGNQISAVSTGGITTNNGNITMTAGSGLDIGKLNLNAGTGNINLSSAGAMTVGALTAKNILAKTTTATANLNIASGKTLTATGAGDALILVAGQNFINNAGSTALSTPAGRWLVYSGKPANDVTGGLISNFRRYTCTYGAACPTLATTGNGFLYRYTPLLTATPNAVSAIYGSIAPALSAYAYTLTGYNAGDAAADTVTGALSGTTAYSQYNAVGNYNVNYASGSLASALGYGFTYANSATALNITPAALTIAAGNLTKTYGDTYSFGSTDYAVTGLKGTDSVTGVTLASAGAAASANVSGSPYTVTASNATGTGLSNYTLTYTNGTLTVNPAALNIAVGNLGKTYGDAYTFGSTDYTITGLKNTDSVTGVTLASAGAAATANASSTPYGVTAASANGNGLANYTINYTNGTLQVGKAALTVTADSLTKAFGETLVFNGREFTTSGLKNSDSVNSVSLGSAGRLLNAAPGDYNVYAGNAVGTGLSNYTVTYVNGTLTVKTSALTSTLNTFGNADFQPDTSWSAGQHGMKPIIQISDQLADMLGIAHNQRTIFSVTAY
ncbi:MAG: filamentous hemagglutinin N-terminal domain-containing protein [Micavibrio sp.]|nr:filamentous hemagglutinin N-terminal domain-containing protein [Micavibrio sp.]